ncbi:MAG: trypsin-like peptidase domain-containing protein [Lachnospiraceae bacterium]|nr:trypsin-like peptidase domain-containing protein [Lachnospiraceae bacterium]
MYDNQNNHTETGSYYDTNGGYIHYDSSSRMKEPGEKKKRGFGKTVAKCLVLALVFGSAASASFMGTNYIGRQVFGDAVTTKGEGDRGTATPTTTVANNSSDVYDVSDIVQNCMPSVVSITNVGTTEFRTFFGTYEQESQSSGSGIIIGRNDTEILIVTNNHVVSGAKEISVYFNSDGEAADEDNVIPAKVKGTDPGKDLAVIAVLTEDIPAETQDMIRIAAVGDSSSMEVGEPVVAIGNAYGYGLSVTSGIVSALNREVSVTSEGRTITNRLIQTDAAINPGNSGGALLNSKGELIGINSVKFISEDVEGMGYAIPISDVESIIGDLMNKVTRDQVKEEDKGYLGITGVDVTSDVSENYGMPEGVYISTITEGGAADRAGLQKGDIITKLDGTRISSYAQLGDTLRYYASGETISITIQRLDDAEYVEKILDITLSSGAQVGAGTEE